MVERFDNLEELRLEHLSREVVSESRRNQRDVVDGIGRVGSKDAHVQPLVLGDVQLHSGSPQRGVVADDRGCRRIESDVATAVPGQRVSAVLDAVPADADVAHRHPERTRGLAGQGRRVAGRQLSQRFSN